MYTADIPSRSSHLVAQYSGILLYLLLCLQHKRGGILFTAFVSKEEERLCTWLTKKIVNYKFTNDRDEQR